MAKCGACGKFLSQTDGASCTKCSSVYHHACVGMPEKGSIEGAWMCPECKKNIPRDNKSDTPVKGVALGSSGSGVTSDNTKTKSTASTKKPPSNVEPTRPTNKAGDLSAELNSKIKQFFREELQAVRDEIKQFRAEMQDIKNTFNNCSERLDTLEERMVSLERRFEERQSVETRRLENLVESLKLELNEKDQDMLCNDFDISNIPEESGENTTHLVTLVAAKLGVKLEDRDIVFAERVGAKNTQLTTDESNENEEPVTTKRRPRTIVVRLARRALRDEVLKCARVRRGADSGNLGLAAAPRTIYVNERLTRYNRQLFKRARDAASTFQWKYVWTKRGRIYARRQQGEQVHWIRKEADLQQVFGDAPEPSDST